MAWSSRYKEAQYNRRYYAANRDSLRNDKNKQARREFLRAVKMHYMCANPLCTGPYPLRNLHFHHIDPHSKLFHPATGDRPLQAVIAEINKCMLLCKWCHKAFHRGKLAISSFKQCELDNTGTPIHKVYV